MQDKLQPPERLFVLMEQDANDKSDIYPLSYRSLEDAANYADGDPVLVGEYKLIATKKVRAKTVVEDL